MSLTTTAPAPPDARAVRALRRILVAGIVLTTVHYTDNYLYFDEYPQPASLRRWQVWAGWLVLTAVGIAGYRLYRRGLAAPAYVCLVVYSYTGTSSLGHYLYGALSEFTPRQHLGILLDGASGIAVLAFVAWSIFSRRRSARRGSATVAGGIG